MYTHCRHPTCNLVLYHADADIIVWSYVLLLCTSSIMLLPCYVHLCCFLAGAHELSDFWDAPLVCVGPFMGCVGVLLGPSGMFLGLGPFCGACSWFWDSFGVLLGCMGPSKVWGRSGVLHSGLAWVYADAPILCQSLLVGARACR